MRHRHPDQEVETMASRAAILQPLLPVEGKCFDEQKASFLRAAGKAIVLIIFWISTAKFANITI